MIYIYKYLYVHICFLDTHHHKMYFVGDRFYGMHDARALDPMDAPGRGCRFFFPDHILGGKKMMGFSTCFCEVSRGGHHMC